MSDVRGQNSSWSERGQKKGKKARKGQQPPLPRKRERVRGRRTRDGERMYSDATTTNYMRNAFPTSAQDRPAIPVEKAMRTWLPWCLSLPLSVCSVTAIKLSVLSFPSRLQANGQRRHIFHLNLRRQVVLRPRRLQGRFGVADIFRRRVDNVKYDPCRHDAVSDSLQPGR